MSEPSRTLIGFLSVRPFSKKAPPGSLSENTCSYTTLKICPKNIQLDAMRSTTTQHTGVTNSQSYFVTQYLITRLSFCLYAVYRTALIYHYCHYQITWRIYFQTRVSKFCKYVFLRVSNNRYTTKGLINFTIL